MIAELREREASNRRIKIALVGAGFTGLGLARQLSRTPGMEIASITGRDPDNLLRAARATGKPFQMVGKSESLPDGGTIAVTQDPFFVLERASELGLDVLVEATGAIGFGAAVTLAAVEKGLHVVLLNAEVDLALGPLLHRAGRDRGVVVTADAGDQPGVLARMIEEIQLWGFRPVLAGNIKGYHDLYATPQRMKAWAADHGLNPYQCSAFTDGTKLGVEMALVSNGTGMRTWVPGMEGPRAGHVSEVLKLFDLEKYGEEGGVDYIIGAEPGGGVFVVGYSDDQIQQPYLKYLKLGTGPYYVFYRPYHLVHLETPRAVAMAVLFNRSILEPDYGRVSDVYAYAKANLPAGERIDRGMGGAYFYGLIDDCGRGDVQGGVPIALLESQNGVMPRMRRSIAKDGLLTFDDIELPQSEMLDLYRQQEMWLRQDASIGKRAAQ